MRYNIEIMSNEKSIVLNILKIFNWQNARQSNQFHLGFYSLKASTLIMEKTISATPNNNEILFNYSLRITYLEEENQIVIRISHLSTKKNLALLGQFTVNLDYLAKKKIQFFPFSKNDKVLKITAGEPQENGNRLSREKVSNNQNQIFIREKESFLRKIASNTSSTSFRNENSRSKKSFSEKAHDLLFEVQGMRQSKPYRPPQNIEHEYHDYYYPYPERTTPTKYDQVKKLGKSESQHRFRTRGLNPVLNPSQVQISRERRDQSQDQKSNRSQKHKLQLKNLDILPVENEYYDEPFNERKLQRKSDILSQNYHSKQKFRPQLY